MRTPSDMPAATAADEPPGPSLDHRGDRPPGRHLRLAAHLRRLLHRRPLVLVGQPALGLAEALRDQGRPDAGLQRHLRRAAPGQPGRGRAAGPQGPVGGRRGRVRQALPRGHRPLRPLAAGRRRGGAVADRRLPGPRPVAELDPLPQQHAVRRPPTRSSTGTSASSSSPCRSSSSSSTGRWSPSSWCCWSPRSATTSTAASACRGHGPGCARRSRPTSRSSSACIALVKAVGLLPGPVQPRPLVQRLRAGRRVHRRPRPAPRPRAADPGVAGRGRAPHLQHPPPGLGPADPRCRPVVPRGPDRRHHLPGRRPGPQGQPGPEHARAPVHPAQHRRHPGRHGDQRRRRARRTRRRPA